MQTVNFAYPFQCFRKYNAVAKQSCNLDYCRKMNCKLKNERINEIRTKILTIITSPIFNHLILLGDSKNLKFCAANNLNSLQELICMISNEAKDFYQKSLNFRTRHVCLNDYFSLN